MRSAPPTKRTIANRLATGFLSMPEPLLARIAGVTGPTVVDGQILHPRIAALLALTERVGAARSDADVEQRRAEIKRFAGIGMPSRTDVRVVERVAMLGDVERHLRVYRPYGLSEPLPGVVYFHGGGWVTGDLDTHDGTCRLLAVTARAVVVAVDYRLAPEHPFPAAIDDGLAGYRWTLDHAAELGAIPDRVGVMGDSAGGTLAAVVALLAARDDDLTTPAAQCLVYPATDAHMRSRSIDLFAEGFFLSRQDMHWFRGKYLPDEADWDDVRASPLLADDLSGLPPAVVVTAGFDPLRDEGMAYADKLASCGVPVVARCYEDLVHGFFGMGVMPGGIEVATEICAAMGELLHEA